MNKKEIKFYIAILIIVIAYWIISFYLTLDPFTKRVTTTITLIGAVTFWLQFKRSERLNESSYIMNLNNQFITNKDMSLVEHELELYYNQYEALLNGRKELPPNEMYSIHLGLNQSRTSEECQKLINYLVYLEALAALVDRQVIHLDVIDDLFSYRFFLAVNNPVVQQDELLPYQAFYQGIFKLSEKWTRNHRKHNIPIPMEQYTLFETNEKWTKDTIMIPLDISEASGNDKKIEIAKCLYSTDRFIYPEAFGDNEAEASKAISRIIGMDGCLLDYKNLMVARYNGQVCGVCLLSDGKGKWEKEKISKRIGPDLLPERIKEGFNHASDEYFSLFHKEHPDENKIEIVAFCVEEGFRRKHVGSALLSAIVKKYGKKTITLTVLAENEAAISLYKHYGFAVTVEEKPGFAPVGLHEPVCKDMERPANA